MTTEVGTPFAVNRPRVAVGAAAIETSVTMTSSGNAYHALEVVVAPAPSSNVQFVATASGTAASIE